MGPRCLSALSVWCTFASVWLFATANPASAAVPPLFEPIAVGDAAFSELEVAFAREQLDAALERLSASPPNESDGFRVRLSLRERSPGVLEATLLVTTRSGLMVGGFTVRASGGASSRMVRLEATVTRIVDEAAASLDWLPKR